MASISNNNIAEAIYLTLKDKAGSDFQKSLKDVVAFLARKRLLSKVPQILSKLRNIQNSNEGIVEAVLTSTEKVDDKLKQNITSLLVKNYKAKQVLFVEKIDKSLIGGVKVEVGSEVIDLSIKNKLSKLQEHLITRV